MTKRLIMILCVVTILGSLSVSGSETHADNQPSSTNPRLAKFLKRTALLDLGLQSAPSIEDYACAQSALSIALDADPTNASLARLLAEAAWSSGDSRVMINATRTIVRNDPKDTVALLRLISAKINTLQTVEGRLQAYNRYLGPGAASIDASVRSRLALDAALLEREVGNAKGFHQRLALSERLDPSNKDTLSLMAQVYSSHARSPVTRLNLQIKLLQADPFDPNIHLAIAKEFATQGAVIQAQRFLTNAVKIYALGGEEISESMREQRIALLWQIEGPQEIVRQLNSSLAAERAKAAAAIEARIAASEPTDGITSPEDIRLNPVVDRIRLLAAFAIDDEETVTAALGDLNTSTAKIQRDINEVATKRSSDQTKLFREYISALLSLEAMRAIVGQEADRMRIDAKRLSESLPAIALLFDRIEPWVLYSEGKFQEARDGINSQALTVNDQLIMALANEGLGDIDEAVVWYDKVARGHSLTAAGAFARSRMVAMDRTESIVTQAGHRMVAIERTIPPWIDRAIDKPTTLLYLSVEPTKSIIGATEDAQLRITLRNLSPVPLALGASRPMESRFLVVPSMGTSSRIFAGTLRPKVLELNQRLRLRPVEQLEVIVDADDPYTDWLLDLQAFTTLRGRWRVLQGFQRSKIGGLTNSPFGLVTETHIVQRLLLEESTLSNERLLGLLNGDDVTIRRKAVRAIASVLVSDNELYRRNLSDSGELIDGLIALYTRASSDERAEMLLVLPHANQFDQMFPFDEYVREQIVIEGLVDQQVIDADLLCAVLLTRVSDPQNPVFETARAHGDQRIRALGELLAQRLADGGQSYATARGMIEELAGPRTAP